MSIAAYQSTVRADVSELTIPASPVTPGRLPAVGRAAPMFGNIYPYRGLHEIAFDRLEPRTFRALELENEFLRLTLLPELGGRLHRALYKPADYDLFYHNPQIQAQLVSTRGAWYAGGVEFNFPVSHSLTTHTGVEYEVVRYADRSAAVLLSNTDRRSRMRWQVAVRIYPECSAIGFATRLINRTPWPQRYYYWLNAAVPQGPQIRYHFAASRTIGHVQESAESLSAVGDYPILPNGADARRPHALPDTTSVFMVNNHSAFFGYYDVDADLGLVRSADVRNTPGCKIFSWGDTDYGRRFNDRLIGRGNQWYGELQSGRPESQLDWGILPPFEVIEAQEWWYPTPGLGELTDGSAEVAMRDASADGFVRLVTTRAVRELTVSVERVTGAAQPPSTRKTFRDVRPADPIELAVPEGDGPLRVRAADASGRVLLDWRSRTAGPRESIIVDLYQRKAQDQRFPDPVRSAHQLTVRAVAAIRADDMEAAEQICREAVAHEPRFGPARRWLGWLLLRQGRWAQALDAFRAAFMDDPMDYSAYYLYAATLLESGDLEQAALELERLIGYAHGQERAWGAVLLARTMLMQGRVDAARRLLTERAGEAAFGPLGRLAYRLGGEPDERSAWWSDPNDPLVLIVSADDPAGVLDEWFVHNVKTPEETVDAVLEVADEFRQVGDEARETAVLDWLARHPALGAVCPIAHYRLGQLRKDLAASAERANEITDRDQMSWLSRRTDEPLLVEVCAAAPKYALSHALLGLLRLSLGRSADAIEPLTRATLLDPTDALAWRNLGLARWTAEGDWQTCWDAYRQAVQRWPDYAPLVAEADRMLADRGAPAEPRRQLLYEALGPAPADAAAVRIRRAALAVVTGDYEHGLHELARGMFHPGEAAFATRDLFATLNVLQGRRLTRQGDWAGALACFRQSLDYPENLGIGRTVLVREGRPRYLMGLALETLGDAAAARAEWEALLPLTRERIIVEGYFKVLALRKLGRDAEADEVIATMARFADAGAVDPSDRARQTATIWAGLVARARGDRERSNRLLNELDLLPEDPLVEIRTSELY